MCRVKEMVLDLMTVVARPQLAPQEDDPVDSLRWYLQTEQDAVGT